uniref:Uncharacterized protein n=1 Tax=Trichuris muris TaxID=70415 RepID=A0A5S6QLL8_TRIMR
MNNLLPRIWTRIANECDWDITEVSFRTYDDISIHFEPYMPVDLSDEYAMANTMVMFLFIGKGTNRTYFIQWIERRIEVILKMEFPKEQIAWDPDQALKCECVEDSARYLERSHLFRLSLWEIMQKLVNEETLFGALIAQILERLKFSRMTGLYLIFEYIMLEIPNPIIYDPYLKTDRAALSTAVKHWNDAAEHNRPYLRILKKNTLCLGGRPLLRLMYIGWKFGVKFQPSLSNWAGPTPADQVTLDKLVEKYSPLPPGVTSVLVVQLPNTEEGHFFPAERGKPSLIQSDNFTTFKAADKEVQQLFKGRNLNKVKEKFSSEGIEWKFITEKAPWTGGY